MGPTTTKRRKLSHSSGFSAVSRSSKFSLEVAQLLQEETVDYARAFKGANDVLLKLKSTMEQTPAQKPSPIHDATERLEKAHRIRVPYPDPRPPADANYKVSFAPPAQFNVIGSYAIKTMTRSQAVPAIDMLVVMPEALLEKKDYLDFRYFYKRSYFLAVLGVALRNALGDSAEIFYEEFHDNALTPILALRCGNEAELESEDKVSDGRKSPSKSWEYRMRIIPCGPDGFFSAKKLHAGTCLIRKGVDAEKKNSPTPFYNSTLKAEGTFLAYLRFLRQANKGCAAFTDACRLGRVWLQQRGFGSSLARGGFGSFEWSVLLALLLRSGEQKGQASLSPSLTCAQLFKAVVQFLSMTNLAKNPCLFGAAKGEPVAANEPSPVIFDAARFLNIAFKMNVSSATMLHQHAKWTHALLNDGSVDPFQPTFITRADLPLQNFDMVVQMKCDVVLESATSTGSSRGRLWDLQDKTCSVLKKALGDRVRLVHVWASAGPPLRPLSESAGPGPSSILLAGLLFDPANMSRRADRGPQVEDKKAAEQFRRFWGKKSELRRFEDGTTREALIWTSTTPEGTAEDMIRYALEKHVGLGHLEDELTFFGKNFQALLPIEATDANLFGVARKQFSVFEQDVRDLKDIPLYVRRLMPACPELRHASVRPPSFDVSNAVLRPMDVVIDFEASGRWPENLAAVQRAKIAFLSRIGVLLEKSKPETIRTYLGLEDAKLDIENLAFLDVVYDTGASFRLRIHSEMEESLLGRRTKDKSLEQSLRTQSASLQARAKRMYINLPLHTASIATYVTRFPSLSATIRLLKHWFDLHKLSCHFTPEFVELAALHVFLVPYPWEAPSSAGTGFLRALLALSRWDWRTEPLVVDTAGELTPEDLTAMDTRLEAWRKLDAHMNHTVLFVATAHDTSGTAYTVIDGQAKPPRVVAARMTALARSAARLVKEGGVDLDPHALFTASFKDYDVLIHLRRKAIRALLQDKEDPHPSALSKYKNLNLRPSSSALPLAQHPVSAFLDQLTTVYSSPLLFFHGSPDTDSIIAAVWDPQLARRGFKTSLPGSYRPVGTVAEVEINRRAILAEIARIGEDLVERVDARGA